MADDINVGKITEVLNDKADVDLENTDLALLENDNGTLKWNGINMSAIGMPSDKYKNLSVGSTGSSYVAPADGWFYYSDQSNGTGVAEIIHVATGIGVRSTAPAATWLRATILPVKKGDTVQLLYENGGSSQLFRFIYAEGAKHLA